MKSRRTHFAIELAALCALGFVATSASALSYGAYVSSAECSSGALSPAPTSCAGNFSGNYLGSATVQEITQANIYNLTGLTTLSFMGSVVDAGYGPFQSSPAGSNAGTLTFDASVSGPFVLALKANGDYSLYFWDGTQGPISSISFDTLGVAVNGNGIGKGLSNASLFGGVMAPIPEADTYAMMLAGLCVVAFVARRRIRQA